MCVYKKVSLTLDVSGVGASGSGANVRRGHRLRSGQGKTDRERRAVPLGAPDRDIAAVVGADVLDDRQTEARFIAALEERNRESAERIRALMFVFEDLSKLDPGGVQTLLRAVEKDQLGLALKGSSDSLREMFFSNMSERAAKIMRDDMDSMGPVRLKDVDNAQTTMVQVAKDLAAKGEIMLAGQGGDDELIY